ncbi:MAG TPA: RraA family protein [Bryobacteraceae bacterium]|nr:RraA family protein [Bryobacteraceae bacterium]HOL72413.1 RraA family protein [Bryobacteraceae bacterium]HOQ47358.1 RraA family protein [Bryobacteraceae bacterium]HPQ14488.1 RraA family protein [Bryobacteraceae bacterium]HPU73481.1 RraA family protein [Bryobacteraceae bacterium]
MKRNLWLALSFALILLFAGEGRAQLGMFTKEQRIEFTREWKGERDEDGRPLVPDSVLERLRETTAEEAWGVLRGARYPNQFASGFQQIVTVPGKRLVGRAVTAVFMPLRPDVNAVINEKAKAEGRSSAGGQNSWVIDILKPGDVVVVDLFGKIKDGTFIGDNLATSIFTKTGTGVVVDGAVRDLSGILQIKGFTGYVRGFDPSAIANVMLVGINVPIRIGETTVMPGDVVLGDPEGVTFIPAHLAERVADVSENTRLRDQWGHQMLREGRYTPGQIDSRWTPEMQAEFKKWAEEQRKKQKK